MIRHVYAFILGMAEYRSAFTTAMTFPHEHSYDRGRAFAHAITLRRFDY